MTEKITFSMVLMLALLVFAGCDDKKSGADAGPVLPDPICLESGNGPYAMAFTDVTADLQLDPDNLRATATILTIVDIDGDHWPDVFLSKASSEREDPDEPVGRYRLLRNTGGAGFEEVTFDSGLFVARDGTEGRATSFIIWADVDNDGDKDAFSMVNESSEAAATLLDHTSIFLNDGTGHFDIGPEQSFTSGQYDPISGAAFLDYNLDGLLDVFTGHWYGTYGVFNSTVQDSLFAGNGLGEFSDVTNAAGLTTFGFTLTNADEGTNHKPTWGVTACDVDGDGWSDLMTSSYGRQFNAFYRNTGGSYEDLTFTSGHGSDGNEDYSDDQNFLCYCEDNPTVSDCAGVPSPMIDCSSAGWTPGVSDQPWRLGGNSSNSVCGDVDNDGDMDILAVELRHWHIGGASDMTELLINDGFPAVPLQRPGNEVTGLVRDHASGWNEGDLGALMADFDNDGRLDVFIASSDYPDTYSLLYQQQADGAFSEVGSGAHARIHRSHGLGLIDYDRDGDYDLIVGTSMTRWSATDSPPAPEDTFAYVLRNDTGQNANKVMIHLRGSGVAGGANRDAVGARITVSAGGDTFMREVQGGYGLNGFQRDDLIIMGIGANCIVDSVTVRWPNATLDEVVYTPVLPNYVLVIEEGQEVVHQSLEEYTASTI